MMDQGSSAPIGLVITSPSPVTGAASLVGEPRGQTYPARHAPSSSSSSLQGSSMTALAAPSSSSAAPNTQQQAIRSHHSGKESIGASFLAMADTDSSPSTSRSSKQKGTGMARFKHQPTSSIDGHLQTNANAVGMSSPSSASLSPSSSSSSSPFQPPVSRFHSANSMLNHSGVLTHDLDAMPGADLSPFAARPRPSTRGAKLGMQMGKAKGSQLTADVASVARAVSPRRAEEPSARMPAANRTHHGVDDPDLLHAAPEPEAGRLTPRASQPIMQSQPSSETKPLNITKAPSIPHPKRGSIAFPSSPSPEESASQQQQQRQHTGSVDGSKYAKAGQLSDETIAELGAMPGIEATSLLNADGQPLSSKNILTIALQKAQSAVLLDGSNNVLEAITAYRQAVRLLEEVMERVSPKNPSAAASSSSGKGSSSSSKRPNREEERRRLKVIHETYAERIRLLSMIYSPDTSADEYSADISTNIQGQEAEDSTVDSAAFDDEGNESDEKSRAILQRQPNVPASGEAVEVDALPLQETTPNANPANVAQPIISIMREDSELDPPQMEILTDEHELRRMDEELVTPATPYFDVDPTLAGERIESEDGHDKEAGSISQGTLRTHPYAYTVEEGRLATPLRVESKGLTGGQAGRVPVETRAPLSLRQIASDDAQVDSLHPQNEREKQQRHETQKALSNQQGHEPQRSKPAFGHATPLVSSSVASGTILKRRKSNAAQNVSVSTPTEALPATNADALAATASTPFTTTASNAAMQSSAGSTFASPSSDADEQADGTLGINSHSSMSAARKRAISQPNQRRPSIPASFLNNRLKADGSAVNAVPTPPLPSQYHSQMPKIKRKNSMPLSFVAANQASAPKGSNSGLQPSAYHSLAPSGGYPLPSPAPSNYSGYHMLGTPLAQYPLGSATNLPEDKAAIIGDLFASPLPSMMLGMPPSYTSNCAALGLPWLGVSNALPDSSVLPYPPSDKVLRPFHIMAQMRSSIEQGAYLTRRLYVSRETWAQTGARLLAIETKTRMIDLISSSIETAEHAGLFLVDSSWRQGGSTQAILVAKFVKQLDEVELVMNETQNTLSKKLGFLEHGSSSSGGSGGAGSDGGAGLSGAGAHGSSAGSQNTAKRSHTLGTLSSKLQRSLNQMVSSHHSSKSASGDASTMYVESLAKLFVRAKMFDEHLRALLSASTTNARMIHHDGAATTGSGYDRLTSDVRGKIETRLKRASDFFANVILRFVIRDITILVDKSLKRSAGLLMD